MNELELLDGLNKLGGRLNFSGNNNINIINGGVCDLSGFGCFKSKNAESPNNSEWGFNLGDMYGFNEDSDYGTKTIETDGVELFALFCEESNIVTLVFTDKQWGLVNEKIPFISEKDFNDLYNNGVTEDGSYSIFLIEESLF